MKMTTKDSPVTDETPEPGDTFIVLRDGVPYIGTEPEVKGASGYNVSPTSGMISLDLPKGTIKPVPGGVDDHHVTVVFLGKDLTDKTFEQACQRAQRAASEMPGPLEGSVGGIGTFEPSKSSEGQVPAFARVNVPGVKDLQSKLADLSASEHKDWKPHVTLAYVKPGEDLPEPVPETSVTFTHVAVHRGETEVRRFPLGKTASGPEDVTDQLVIVLAKYNPDELRDPHTGKWIKDPKGKYLDFALKELKQGKMLSHNGHEVDKSSKGFNVRHYKKEPGKPKVKAGEGKTYQHAEDAAEALRRGKHLNDSELKHGASHVGEGEIKTGLTPDKRKWTMTVADGGVGSTYEIDAKPDGDKSQYRDMATRATYLGNGRVKIEHQDEQGNWAVQPGSPADGWTFTALEGRTKLYREMAHEMGAAQEAESKAKPKPPKSKLGEYQAYKSPGTATKVKTILTNEKLPNGQNDAIAHKAFVAQNLAEKLSGVPVTDLMASVWPEGYQLYAGNKETFMAAAENPSEWGFSKTAGGNLNLEKNIGGKPYPGFEPLTDKALREYAASQLIQGWAGTSNDNDPRALAMQEAAIQEFDLKGTAGWTKASFAETVKNVQKAVKQHGAVYKKFLRAQWELTQEDFKKRGIKEVNVVRGMAFSGFEGAGVPNWIQGPVKTGDVIDTPPLRPMSSWTVNAGTATSFAVGGTTSVVLGATVPVEAILSYPRTGYGCKNEYELVLLASSGKVTVRKVSIGSVLH